MPLVQNMPCGKGLNPMPWCQGWEFALRFSERIARFLQKMSDLSEWLTVAHFWWAILSQSLFCHEFTHIQGMSKSLVFFKPTKNPSKTYKSYNFIQIYLSESLVFLLWVKEWLSDSLERTSDSLICSFIMSKLSDSLMVTLLSWATWAICLWSLFYHERPERFAHSRSFVLYILLCFVKKKYQTLGHWI